MTATQAMLLSAGQATFEVTLAAAGGGADVVGFVRTLLGSISPSSLRGVLVDEARSSTSTNFLLLLDGAQPATSFRRVLVQNGSGVLVRFESSDATYDNFGSQTQWLWGDGGSRVWVAAMAGQVQKMVFVF